MKIVKGFCNSYLLTGNRPCYRMKIFIEGRTLSWGRKRYPEEQLRVTMYLASHGMAESLHYFLCTMNYPGHIYFHGKDVDELINPSSPSTQYFDDVCLSEVRVSLGNGQELEEFFKNLREFNREKRIKIMYYYKKNCFILA